MTLRDKVWDAVLKKLVQTGSFKISDLPFEERNRHTVRRVLREMEDLGWLERNSKRAAIWRIGDTGKLLLNVSAEKIKEAQKA